MKVSTENDNNFGYEKITIVVDNMLLMHVNRHFQQYFNYMCTPSCRSFLFSCGLPARQWQTWSHKVESSKSRHAKTKGGWARTTLLVMDSSVSVNQTMAEYFLGRVWTMEEGGGGVLASIWHGASIINHTNASFHWSNSIVNSVIPKLFFIQQPNHLCHKNAKFQVSRTTTWISVRNYK